MKGIFVLGMLFIGLLTVGFVSAGSVDGCERFATRDVNCHQVCTGQGHSRHCDTVCDKENYCADNIAIVGDVDADTLNGLNASELSQTTINQYNTQGGGVSADYVNRILGINDNLLLNFKSFFAYIDSLYVRQSEYDQLKHKVDLMETVLIAKGIDMNSTQLELDTQKRIGNNVHTTCLKDAEGVEHCVIKKG